MRQGIIEVGTNAVRLVIYADNNLGSAEIYVQRYKINISKLLNSENYNANDPFFRIIAHINHILKLYNVKSYHCVATSVLRNHPNSQKFINFISYKYNIDIEILSGKQEAHLNAVGIIVSIKNACGIVADLGGGSLELSVIESNGQIGNHLSLEIGAKLTTNKCYITDNNIIKQLEEYKKSISHYNKIYLIGGGFRMLGKKYFKTINYALKNLHSLEIATQDLEYYINSNSSLNTYVSKVLKVLFDIFKPTKSIISNYSLKEGLRYTLLPQHEKDKNLTVEMLKNLSLYATYSKDILNQYCGLVIPWIIDQNDQQTFQDILEMALVVNSMSNSIDQNFRANFLSQMVLTSNIPFAYRERVMLATIIFVTFKPFVVVPFYNLIKSTLSKTQYISCVIIGKILFLSGEIDGLTFHKPSFKLQYNLKNELTIHTSYLLPQDIFIKSKCILKYIQKVHTTFKNK